MNFMAKFGISSFLSFQDACNQKALKVNSGHSMASHKFRWELSVLAPLASINLPTLLLGPKNSAKPLFMSREYYFRELWFSGFSTQREYILWWIMTAFYKIWLLLCFLCSLFWMIHALFWTLYFYCLHAPKGPHKLIALLQGCGEIQIFFLKLLPNVCIFSDKLPRNQSITKRLDQKCYKVHFWRRIVHKPL